MYYIDTPLKHYYSPWNMLVERRYFFSGGWFFKGKLLNVFSEIPLEPPQTHSSTCHFLLLLGYQGLPYGLIPTMIWWTLPGCIHQIIQWLLWNDFLEQLPYNWAGGHILGYKKYTLKTRHRYRTWWIGKCISFQLWQFWISMLNFRWVYIYSLHIYIYKQISI